MRPIVRSWVTGLAATVLLTGCGSPYPIPSTPGPAAPATTATTSQTASPGPSPPATPTVTPPAPTPTEAPPTETTPTEPAPALAGRVIVVDPGHNGRYRKSFNTKKVPSGNGRKKACNSSGTGTGEGYAEHTYNWEQAGLLKQRLEALGATVLLTRSDDDSLGPCINLRAAVANEASADLLISIHADGELKRGARGFHVIVSTTMAGGRALEKQSRRLAEAARDALEERTTMPGANYLGENGLSLRDDIGTLNLLETTPGIMMEMGNMRNAKDAALLKSPEFQQAAADALAQAAVAMLNG